MSRRYRESWMDRFTPDTLVRVLLADGGEAVWRQDAALQSVVPALETASSPITAVEYPEDRLLRRHLTLPDMPATEVAEAAGLDAVTSSPFRADDLVWGHLCQPLTPGKLSVDIVLASRKQVQQYLDQLGARLAGQTNPEVWAFAGSTAPVVIRGFGEGIRARRQARQRWLLCGLLFVAWCLTVGVALTPTAQLRLRAIEAIAAFDSLHQRTAALVLKRESLSRAVDQLTAMDEIFSERVRAVEIMDLLTRALPDDTSLLSMQIQGAKVRLTGQTANTADLMQKLSAYPGLRDVNAPSAATRPLGANKESFSIEIELTPGAFKDAESNRVGESRNSAAAPAQKASSP
ncbi:MAG: PilN domain-containing protein [Pseudomonadota bacterium]|nr:PilN domain-containing protein [Pseudomonadota bacterium]